MELVIISIFHHWFFHPLHGLGYQFWSGIAGSFLTSLPGWFIAGGLFFRHQNCHTPWCPKIARFHLEGTPYKLCKKHHPDIPKNLTLHHIHLAHKRSKEGALKVTEGS